MFQPAECLTGKSHRRTCETRYRSARRPYVFAAADEAVGAYPREWRSQSIVGALQYDRRSAQVWTRAGQDNERLILCRSTKFMLTDKEVQKVRSRFSIFQRKIYLNSCSQGALSDTVQSGLDDYIASW